MNNLKKFEAVFVLLLFITVSFNLEAQKIKLQFKNDKTFKIAQFTDTHYFEGGSSSDEVLENIRFILSTEKPDLVVLTGDIVTGDGDDWPTIASWKSLTDQFIEYKVPYAVVFGNHDDEAQTSRGKLFEFLSERPYCLISDEGNEEVAGTGNYVVPVYDQSGGVDKLIYCMDSRSYSLAKDKGVKGYGWFDRSQIDWFARTNQSWLAKSPGAKALLFFHIPLPEYKKAYYEGEYHIGVRMEDECSPEINTGMFSEMVLQGNVMGSFTGHDHDNNYLAQLYGIALAYGYFSGGNSYINLPFRGSRIILLEEGSKIFTTWLRRSDGKKLYQVKIPYVKK